MALPLPVVEAQTDELPRFSMIIPSRPGGDVSQAVESIRRLRYPMENIEILQVEGTNPSLQRNLAIFEAEGDLLYFLDDDSCLAPDATMRALECFLDEERGMDLVCVGGPVLTHATDGPFQRAVGAAMASVFGLGPSRHRFVPYGLIRRTSEKELISANFVFRKATFSRVGGFDPRLYPNEENELLKRVESNGMACMYHPLMVVFRSRRKNIFQVAKQNFRYGRGRMMHFFRDLRPVDVVLLAPLLFLVLLAVAAIWPTWITVLPVLFYLQMSFAAATLTALSMQHKVRSLVYLLVIFPTMHIAYGLGLLWGLLKLPGKNGAVPENHPAPVVKRLKAFGESH